MNLPICAASLECLSKVYENSPEQLEQFKAPLYDLVGASKEDHFFCVGSHLEAVQHVLLYHYFEVARKTGKNHFITAGSEDAPIFLTLKRLEDAGCVVDTIPFQNGKLDVDSLQSFLGPKTALVTLSWANQLTGCIHDIEKIGAICKKNGVLLHVDASETLGKVFCSFQDSPISFLTFSGIPLHAPVSGGLFVKEDEDFRVHLSDLDLPRFASLSAAAKQSLLYMDQMVMETGRLRDLFEGRIRKEFPDVEVLYPEKRLPHISALSIPKVFHESLLYRLKKRGVYATSGGNHVQPFTQILGDFSAVSLYFSRYSTERQVLDEAEVLIEEIRDLRKISDGLFA